MNIGELFAQQRKKKGISLETAGEKTRIKIEFIRALEEEVFDVLPPEPFAGGFVKSYALFLELNAAEMYDLYRDTRYGKEKLSADVAFSLEKSCLVDVSKKSRIRAIARKFFFSIFLVVLGGSAWIYLTSFQIFQKEIKPNPAVCSEPILSPVLEIQELVLDIYTKENCWVDIHADEAPLFTGTLKRSKKTTWKAQQKFVFKIGNVYALEAEVNEKKIDLIKGQTRGVNTITIDRDMFNDNIFEQGENTDKINMQKPRKTVAPQKRKPQKKRYVKAKQNSVSDQQSKKNERKQEEKKNIEEIKQQTVEKVRQEIIKPSIDKNEKEGNIE